jgi:streptogramin lyase
MIQLHASSHHRRTRYRHAIRHLEALEPRTLMSAVISSYSLPGLAGLGTYDSSGALWIYDVNTAALERIKDGMLDIAPGSVILLDSMTYQPIALSSGPNGHIYMVDAVGAIDDIDPALAASDPTAGITQTPVPAIPDTNGMSISNMPTALTVSGNGSVWFLCHGGDSSETFGHTSVIGRMDPGTHSVSVFTTDSLLEESYATKISADGADSVWVGMGAAYATVDPGLDDLGTNRIGNASWDGGAISLTTYLVDTGTDTDAHAVVNGVASDGQSGVWFTLSTVNGTWSDLLVHGVVDAGDLAQTAYADPSVPADTHAGFGPLVQDAEGNVWFLEYGVNKFGSFDPATNQITAHNNTTDGQLYQMVTNADGTQISLLNGPDNDGNSPIIRIDVTTSPVTFSGTANNVNVQEDVVLDNVGLATFTAPEPLIGYTVTIDWGDSTSTIVTPTLLPGSTDTYAVIVSGKSFATQGVYDGSITVLDGTASVGTLSFTSTISDIPLNVTSFTVSPLLARIVIATGAFTDDPNLALSTWRATISWGDGTSSTGLIVRDPTQAGRYLVLAIHQYRTRGTYTARLTVTTSEADAAVGISSLTTTVTAR